MSEEHRLSDVRRFLVLGAVGLACWAASCAKDDTGNGGIVDRDGAAAADDSTTTLPPGGIPDGTQFNVMYSPRQIFECSGPLFRNGFE